MRPLALLLALACVAAVVNGMQPSCDAERITCKTCQGNADSNTIPTLPRRDRNFQEVSSNLADYPFITCKNNSCSFNSSVDIKKLSNGTDPRSPYLESLLAYFAVAILFVLLTCIYLPLFVIWRYCCCCCCKLSQKCKCGGKFPTRRTFCMGYSHQDGHRFEYPLRSRILSLIYLIVFLALMITWIVMAEFKGNKAFSIAMKTVATTTFNPVMDLTVSVVPPLATFIIGLSSSTFSHALSSIKTIFTVDTNLTYIHTNLQCSLAGIDNLPDMGAIITDVLALNSSGHDVLSALTVLNGNLTTAVIPVNTSLVPAVNQAKTDVTSFSGKVSTLVTNMASFSVSLGTIASIQTSVVGTWGFETLAKANLSIFQSYYPTNATAADTSTQINLLLGGGCTGTTPSAIACQNQLTNDLLSLANSLGNLTNVVASSLDDYNTKAAAVQSNVLSAVFSQRDATVAAVNALSGLPAALNSSLASIVNLTQFLGLTPTSGALQQVYSAVSRTIDLDSLHNELERILGVNSLLVCLDNAIIELLTLNETAISLPSQVRDVLNLVDDLNSTLAPVSQKVVDAQSNISDIKRTIDSYGIQYFAGNVSMAQDNLTTAVALLNLAQLQAQFTQFNNALLGLDFTPVAAVSAFSSALTNARIQSSLSSSLTGAAGFLSSLSGNVSIGVGDIQHLAQGYCGEHPAQYCTADSPGCTCENKGVSRCENDQTKTCSMDSDCGTAGTGVHCMTDPTSWNTLLTLVNGIKDHWVNVSSAIDLLTGVEIAASFNFTPLLASTATATSAANQFDFPTLTSSLNGISAAVLIPTVPVYLGMSQGLNSTFSAISYDAVLTPCRSFNSTVIDFQTSKRGMIVDAVNGSGALSSLFSDQFPQYLSTMSADNLNAAFAHSGLTGIIAELTSIADNASAHIVSQTTLVSSSFRTHFEKSFSTGQIAKVLDVLSLPVYRQYGSIYFFASLAQVMNVSSVKVVPGWQSHTHDVKLNDAGARYANGAYCFTDTCIANTVALVNTVQLGSSATKSYAKLPVAIPLTRENLFELLLVIPTIVVLLGLLGICCAGCCCRNKPAWQKVPVSWMTGVTFCQMPCIFLIASGFFVFVIFTGDMCQSYGGIGMQYVHGKGDSLCKDLLKGNGTAAQCNFTEKAFSNHSVDLTMNIPQAYVSLITDCPAGILDPIAAPLHQAADQVKSWALDEVNSYLDKHNNGTVVLRDNIKNILRDAANSTGYTVSTFLHDIATDTLTCKGLSAVKSRFHENVCCDFLTALYWWVGCWYLMAWTMFFCGCCSGTLARKRLPRFPWGAHYDMDVTEIPHMGTLEMVMSPTQLVEGTALYPTLDDGNKDTAYPSQVDYGSLPTMDEYANYKGEYMPTAPQAFPRQESVQTTFI